MTTMIENLDLRTLIDDCIFEITLEVGYSSVKPKCKDIIELRAMVNCDKNSIKYYIENMATGQILEFDNYRKALGKFKSNLL